MVFGYNRFFKYSVKNTFKYIYIYAHITIKSLKKKKNVFIYLYIFMVEICFDYTLKYTLFITSRYKYTQLNERLQKPMWIT